MVLKRVPAHYDVEAAKQPAADFLTGYPPDVRITSEQAFSGYYTFGYGRDATERMRSVNAHTGEVWVHSWHGPFLLGRRVSLRNGPKFLYAQPHPGRGGCILTGRGEA